MRVLPDDRLPVVEYADDQILLLLVTYVTGAHVEHATLLYPGRRDSRARQRRYSDQLALVLDHLRIDYGIAAHRQCGSLKGVHRAEITRHALSTIRGYDPQRPLDTVRAADHRSMNMAP